MRRSYFDNFFCDDFFSRPFSWTGNYANEDRTRFYPRHWIAENRFNQQYEDEYQSEESDEEMEIPQPQSRGKIRKIIVRGGSPPSVRRQMVRTPSPIEEEESEETDDEQPIQEFKKETEIKKQPEEYDPYVEWVDEEDVQIRDDIATNPSDDVDEIFASFDNRDAVEIGGVNISTESIRTLSGRNWLDDAVINGYMSLLYAHCKKTGRKVHFFAPCSTYFFELLTSPKFEGDTSRYNYDRVRRWTKNVDLLKMDKIIIPICVGGNHWTMACINIRDRQFEYYDSMIWNPNHREIGNIVLDKLCKYLEDDVKDKHKITLHSNRWRRFVYSEKEIPQQENGFDCGVFLCLFARSVCLDKKLDYRQDQIPQYRRILASNLLHKTI
jgi:sentrin-specific protease 1